MIGTRGRTRVLRRSRLGPSLDAGVLLVRLPVPLLEECTWTAEDWASPMAIRRTGRLGRTIASSIALHASLALVTAVSEGTAWTTESIERALPPGDVPDAAENQEPPWEVRTAVVVAELLQLTRLNQGVSVAVVIGVIDEPEPAQNEQTD